MLHLSGNTNTLMTIHDSFRNAVITEQQMLATCHSCSDCTNDAAMDLWDGMWA